MYFRVAVAVLTLTALASSPKPAPSPTPLKVIKHVYSTSRLCTGLRRSIAPAVGRMLQNDKAIARSRPLLQEYAKNANLGSEAGKDMAVERLETLITPLVQNTQAIERYLKDPLFARRPDNENDKQLLAMRAHLNAALASQKKALELVSGFVNTQQLGQLQAAGNENQSALSDPNDKAHQQKPSLSPTSAPDATLSAGVSLNSDPVRQNDPRFTPTGSDLGYNPLNAFDQQMQNYQIEIAQSEGDATTTIMKSVTLCGGKSP